MSSKLVSDPRLNKAQAHLQEARNLINKMTPSVGEPDPTTKTLEHMATVLAALTAVLSEHDDKR